MNTYVDVARNLLLHQNKELSMNTRRGYTVMDLTRKDRKRLDQ
jgi:hypothetical protein